MQLGVALGTVSGYLVTSLSLYLFSNVLIILNQWVYPYYLQIILLIPCLILYSLSDEKLLSTQEETEQNIIEKQSFKDILKQNLNIFLTNPLFVYTILSLSSLFFVVTGIQFWITDYLRMVLLMPHELVFKAFLIISLSAPLSGVYLGGLILHYYGGYDGNNAMRIVSIEALCASVSGFFIPFSNNGWVVLIFLWFLLFFGGSAVPAIMGIMISSIPKEQRSSGNSLSHLFQELLGYLPAPVLYGYVQSLTGGQTSRWGMILLAFWGFFGFVFIVIGMYSKKRDTQFDTSFNQSEEQDKVAIELPRTKIDINNKKDFSYIRMQTSIQSGKSINLVEKSPRDSNDSKQTPLLYEMESMRIRNAFRRQTSFQQTITNVSCLLGRGSLDADTFQQKEEFLRQKSKKQQSIELQVSGQLYLMSEGRYVQQK